MWLIGLPAWGERYLDTLTTYTIPSLRACLKPAAHLRIISHTDAPDRVRAALDGYDVDVRPVPTDQHGRVSYASMSNAHKQVMGLSAPGDYITLMCADVIFSRECFVAAEARFREGFKAVVCTGMRTVGALFGNTPPVGFAAADLLTWAVAHRHPIITQSMWPHGQASVPSQIYFDSPNGVTARLFTPCLFGIVNDRGLDFTGTIDRDLLECFATSEIHVVTSRHELAVVEVSPLHKSFGFVREPMSAKSLAEWAKGVGLRRHNYWFLGHSIEVTGVGDGTDEAVVREIMAHTYQQAVA